MSKDPRQLKKQKWWLILRRRWWVIILILMFTLPSPTGSVGTFILLSPIFLPFAIGKQKYIDEMNRESQSPSSESVKDQSQVLKEQQDQALEKAKEMMRDNLESKHDLYQKLIDSKFEENAAQYAVDHVGRDWQQVALTKAQQDLRQIPKSKQNTYQKLTKEEHFTAAEAQYAVDHVPVDWQQLALETAKNYFKYGGKTVSKKNLYLILTGRSDLYSPEEAQYAIDHLDIDWNGIALMKAKEFQESGQKPAEIRKSLLAVDQNFTEAEADYALSHLNDAK